MGEQRLQPKEVLEPAVNEHSSTNSAEYRRVEEGLAREGRGANGEKGQFWFVAAVVWRWALWLVIVPRVVGIVRIAFNLMPCQRLLTVWNTHKQQPLID